MCRGLDEVLSESGEGNITILSWVAWLQSDCGASLQIESPFAVSPLDGLDKPSELDVRAHNQANSAEEVLRLVVESDKRDKQRAFNSGLHSCRVCFEDVPGLRALKLLACSHIFCKGCMG